MVILEQGAHQFLKQDHEARDKIQEQEENLKRNKECRRMNMERLKKLKRRKWQKI